MSYNEKVVQQIFNAVIAAGYYSEHEVYDAGEISAYGPGDKRDFMCGALRIALHFGVISAGKYVLAKKAVSLYMDQSDRAYLESALKEAGMPSSFEYRLALYKDWANRPNLNPKVDRS